MKKKYFYGIAAAILLNIAATFPSYAGSWLQTTDGWKYLNDNGTPISSQWIEDQ